MFNAQTVIVVGAGASAEVGLPCGSDLQALVAQSLSFQQEEPGRFVGGDANILEALRMVADRGFDSDDIEHPDFDQLVTSAAAISRAMPLAPSIDNYINASRGNRCIEIAAKIAIVSVILRAESHCKLTKKYSARPDLVDVSRLQQTWFNRFMRLLGEDCPLSEAPQRLSSIAFVVFNYDRCIEHYLHNALQIFYNIDPPIAADLMSNLRIYHPYGCIGKLPWEHGSDGVPFGEAVRPQVLARLARRIYTFSEGTDPTLSRITNARNALREARMVLFLGFAFHPLNLELLFGDAAAATPRDKISCFATTYGMSDSDSKTVVSDLQRMLRAGLTCLEVRNGLTCMGLFDEYRRRLTLG